MGKILSLLVGGIVLVAGLILLVSWWFEFLFLLRASVPVLMLLGGAIAILAGVSEYKDTLKSKSEKK